MQEPYTVTKLIWSSKNLDTYWIQVSETYVLNPVVCLSVLPENQSSVIAGRHVLDKANKELNAKYADG